MTRNWLVLGALLTGCDLRPPPPPRTITCTEDRAAERYPETCGEGDDAGTLADEISRSQQLRR
ncbi:MAG: hypothetical protein ABW321_16430 [Polyangiales bacterium]